VDNQSVKKRAKLVELKSKLLRGEHIQNRQLKNCLGDGAIKEIKDDWESQKLLRADLSSPPEEITEYKKRLHKVTFTYSRAERLSQRKSASAEKMYHQSEAEAEELIEFLHGILHTDQSLQMWFDRLPDANNRGLTPESLPQVINSRSRFNQGGGFSSAIKSKQEVKIDAVERAISAIDSMGPIVSEVAEVTARVGRMRATLKRQD